MTASDKERIRRYVHFAFQVKENAQMICRVLKMKMQCRLVRLAEIPVTKDPAKETLGQGQEDRIFRPSIKL